MIVNKINQLDIKLNFYITEDILDKLNIKILQIVVKMLVLMLVKKFKKKF